MGWGVFFLRLDRVGFCCCYCLFVCLFVCFGGADGGEGGGLRGEVSLVQSAYN